MNGIFKILTIIALLVGTPLLGILLNGSPLAPYLALPPTPAFAEFPSFSWYIFSVLFLGMAIVLAPFVSRFLSFRPSEPRALLNISYPWWGWGGLAFLLLAWTLAWSRFPWFQPFQGHTFTPLWIGYVLVINALTFQRTGHCLLTRQPYFYASLFPLSAGFWWLFEFLNRFVHNWYYPGSDEFTPTTYFLAATIPFSTVMPAVLGTHELLKSFPRLRLTYENWGSLYIPEGRAMGWVMLLLACAGLLGISWWPDLFYPVMWVSPLVLVVGLQRILGEHSLLDEIKRGDWSQVVIPALAGLTCGFFWELWNYYSLAKWNYLVPYVQGFHLFEMPLLGYFGYLPFGVTNIIFVQFLLGQSSYFQVSNRCTTPHTEFSRIRPTTSNLQG